MAPAPALAEALDALRGAAGVELVEARYEEDEREQLLVRDGRVDRVVRGASSGFGVRVLAGGAWGFAARPGGEGDGAAARAAAHAALAVARAAAPLRRTPVVRCDESPQCGRWDTPVREDAFAVPTEEKLALLLEAVATARAAGPAVRASSAHLVARRLRKELRTSEGTDVVQRLAHAGAGVKVIAADGALVQQRTYPLDFDGGVAGGGFEVVRALELRAGARRAAEEAIALLAAPPVPAGRRTVLLLPSQLALQVHESCGHPAEGDRALGEELSLAGGSFLTPDRLGRFRYGSPLVNLSADALTDGALGTFGWDDEGVPARRTPLVEGGLFVGYLTSREVAARVGAPRSAGAMRAESWGHTPIIRMLNVGLDADPRGPTLDELIADTADGLLLEANKSWSIDDLRLNFQFGCELAWEIRGGRRGRLLRNPVYTGSTPDFWAACDAVCAPSERRMVGLLSCGKGDPMQTMWVGHGCPPARFLDVEVGAG